MSSDDHLAYRGVAHDDARREWKDRSGDSCRDPRPWQLGFLLRFTLHLAFYGWVAWLVLGKPEIPIRWLQ